MRPLSGPDSRAAPQAACKAVSRPPASIPDGAPVYMLSCRVYLRVIGGDLDRRLLRSLQAGQGGSEVVGDAEFHCTRRSVVVSTTVGWLLKLEGKA